jgi:hypothetical protein
LACLRILPRGEVLIEHIYTWKCDYPGCESEQRAQVWINEKARPLGLCPLDGWGSIETENGIRHYCRTCTPKILDKGD